MKTTKKPAKKTVMSKATAKKPAAKKPVKETKKTVAKKASKPRPKKSKKGLEWFVMNYEHSWSKGERREPKPFNVFNTISFSGNFYELRNIDDREKFEVSTIL